MTPRTVRRKIIPGLSAVVALALAISAAFLTSGFKPVESTSVVSAAWISKSGSTTTEGSQFGRINLSAGELDSFLSQSATSEAMLQAVGSSTIGISGSTVFAINDSSPDIDLTGGTVAEADKLDTGAAISQVFTGAGTVLLIDQASGRAFSASSASFAALKASFGEIIVSGSVVAGQVSTSGTIFLLERTSSALVVETYERSSAKLSTVATLTGDVDSSETVQLGVVGEQWVVLAHSQTSAEVFTASALGGVDVSLILGSGLRNAQLVEAASGGSRALIGVPAGLFSVPLTDPGNAVPIDIDGLSSTAAVSPLVADANGCVLGAWLDSSANSGVTATICGDSDPASHAMTAPSGSQASTAGTPVLKMRGDGTSIVINDIVSGRAWQTDGSPIASTWNWTDPDDSKVTQTTTTDEVQQAKDPMAPVANDDTYSIRPGKTSTVPVQINDTDPNGDPFSIAQTSGKAPALSASTPAGVSVQVVNNGTELAVTVPASVTSGTISLTYADTDGTSQSGDGGLYSNTATVTLTVVPATVNTAPKRVQTTVSTIPVACGGNAVVNVLQWWSDGELDPLVVGQAALVNISQSSEASVVVQPDGSILFRHFGACGTGPYQVSYTVDDGYGGEGTDTLTFQITSEMTADNFATSAVAGTPLTVDLTSWVHGASSSAKVSVTGVDGVSYQDGLFGFVFTPTKAGEYVIPYTVTDSGSVSGRVLVHVVDAASATLTVSPLTIRVRSDEYQTVDISDSIFGAGADVALVTAVSSQTKKVDATVLDFSRISAITNDTVGQNDGGTTIDTLTYTVQAGSRVATGQISVYLLPTQSSTGAPVVVNDSVTVASGSQVDIPVLDNDRDPNDGALSLNAAWTSQDPDGAGASALPAEDGVYFPSTSVIRYLAPSVTSTKVVTFEYDAIGSNGVHAQGTVTVTVVPGSKSTASAAPTLTARVVSKGTVTIAVPTVIGGVLQSAYFVSTSGLTGVDEGIATVASDRSTLTYVAPLVQSSTTISFMYTVQLSSGDQVQGTVMIGVSATAANLAPIAVTDFVAVKSGQDARVNPVANDISTDSANSLTLGTVTLASGAKAAAYEVGSTDDPYSKKSDQHAPTVSISLASGSPGTLVIHPLTTDNISTVTLAYQVLESDGLSSIGRVIVSFVNGNVNLYPVVSDTTVTTQDYANSGFSVDVVSGKVSWGSGDASTLTVSNFTGQSGIDIQGHTVSGTRPQNTVRIPLSFSGTTSDGTAVTGYAFLVILGSNDEAPTIASTTAVQVNAGESHTFDIATDVVVPSGGAATIASVDSETISGKASKDSDTRITYTANEDGGGSDSIRFVVNYTFGGTTKQVTLAFPVYVVAKTPDVTVSRGTTGEVAPAETLSLSFLSLVNPWTGTTADKANLTYTITPVDAALAQSQFTSLPTGGTLGSNWQITASESAKVGTTVRFALVVSSADKQSQPVYVDVTIVNTYRNLPQAATCSASIDLSGASAITKSYGVANGASGGVTCSGGYNPFSGDLTVANLSASSTAGGLSFTASGGSIVVSVPDPTSTDIPNTVVAQFSVVDVQGRTSSNSSRGTLTITFKARPQPPTLTLTSYSTNSVSFSVTQNALGGSPDTYVLETLKDGNWSEVSSQKSSNNVFVYSSFGGTGSAAAQDFRVYAKNSVDSSDKSSVLSGIYPQSVPEAPANLTWTPDASRLGYVTVHVDGSGSTAESWTFSGVNQRDVTNNKGNVDVSVNVGQGVTATVTVTGASIPCGLCRSATSQVPAAVGKSVTVTAFGVPSVSGIGATVVNGDAEVTFTPSMNGPTAGSAGMVGTVQWLYCITTGSSCTPDTTVTSNGTSMTVDAGPAARGSTTYTVLISNGASTSAPATTSVANWPSATDVQNAFHYTVAASKVVARWFVPEVLGVGPSGYTYTFRWAGANQTTDGTAWINAASLPDDAFRSSVVEVEACASTCSGNWVQLSGTDGASYPSPVSFSASAMVTPNSGSCSVSQPGNWTATIIVSSVAGISTSVTSSSSSSVTVTPSGTVTGNFLFDNTGLSAAGINTSPGVSYSVNGVSGTCTPVSASSPAP